MGVFKNRVIKSLILGFIFLLFVPFLSAKQPQLDSFDVKIKANEILKSHVLYKSITPQIAERILLNFLEELDPNKTYWIESDIQEWITPSPALLQKVIEGYKKADYGLFFEIHNQFLQTIKRRHQLDEKLPSHPIPPSSEVDKFADQIKNLSWAKSTDELSDRLCKINALQIEVSKKFEEEPAVDLIRKKLEKHRLMRETKITGGSSEERRIFVLSCVLKALCSALDEHTTYFTPSEAAQFMIQVKQSLCGIGAQLRDNLNGFKVVRIVEGSPASQSNLLKVNDLIIAVNKEPIVGMEITDAVELIRGEKGSPVFLTILREGADPKQTQKLDIELIRGEIALEESRFDSSAEPFGDGAIAYLRLFSFYQNPSTSSSKDLKKALATIKKEHKLKGVILDLRGNGGGLLPEAVSVSGLFLSKGIVVSVKDNSGNIQHLRNMEDSLQWDGPLLILVDRGSASASEIVAQTLQDYGRGIVVGDKETFGKGTFQTFTLDTSPQAKINPQGEYKVTRGMYYTVSGKSPQLQGVLADIVVSGVLSEMEIGEKYSKYPLEGSSIQPHFQDTLDDIPAVYRNHIRTLYENNLQEKLTDYTRHLPLLRENSKKRIEGNPTYQAFLNEIKNKHFDSKSVDNFGQNDLQLREAYNIMKDLIFFFEVQDKHTLSY